jgi:thiamine kinase-like enzyme
MKNIIKDILKNGKISSMSLEAGVGSTGEAHLAILEGKKYLLRICPDKATAKKYLGYYNKFKKYDFFPRLLELYGKYMLFEFIIGRRCSEKESPKTIYQVGKICSLINKVNAPKSYKRGKSFVEKLQEIERKKVISPEIAEKVLKTYKKLERVVKFKLALDAGDVTCDNFMKDNNGKIYFVDIEAIKPNIKGMGIAKAFSTWFKTEKDQKQFRKGYESVGSMKFYTKYYGKLLTLTFFIQRIRFKYNKGEMDMVNRTIIKLERLIQGEEA